MLMLTNEDKLLLMAMNPDPDPSQIVMIRHLAEQITNWKYLNYIASGNSVAPLLYQSLKTVDETIIPRNYLLELKQIYYKSLQRNILIYNTFSEVAALFKNHCIDCIALKGIFLAEHFYHDIGLRQMSDIDLLIHPEDAESCQNLLSANGFHNSYKYKSNYIVKSGGLIHLPAISKNGISVELHLKIHPENDVFKVNIEHFFKEAKEVTINGTKVFALSPAHLLQHLCVHLDQHFKKAEIQLFSFCDITEVLKKYLQQINWPDFEKECQEYNILNTVYRYFKLCNHYLQAPLPKCIIDKLNSLPEEPNNNIFILYLKSRHEEAKKFLQDQNIASLKKIRGFTPKATFLLNNIFPSKGFMMQRYKIKNKNSVFFYYFLRAGVGIKLLFNILTGSMGRKNRKS